MSRDCTGVNRPWRIHFRLGFGTASLMRHIRSCLRMAGSIENTPKCSLGSAAMLGTPLREFPRFARQSDDMNSLNILPQNGKACLNDQLGSRFGCEDVMMKCSKLRIS